MELLNNQTYHVSLQANERPNYNLQKFPGVPHLSPYRLILQLRKLWPEACKEFCCIFQYHKEPDSSPEANSVSFGAIGAAAEIKVFLNQDQIDYQFKIENTIIFTKSVPHAGQSLSYPLLFENLSSVVKRAKDVLCQYFEIADEDQEALCFFGGWQSSQKMTNHKEIAVFTLPRMTINQAEVMEVGRFIHPHFPAFSLEQINFSQSKDAFTQTLVPAHSITDIPEQSQYLRNLNSILAKIGNSEASKVVLSIKKSLHLTQPAPDPVQLSYRLAERYGQVYDYFFQWNSGKAWFGVSPEVLLQKVNRNLITKPLAGTCKIKKEEDIPARISNFLNDSKENLEHQLTVEQMVRDLKNVCEYEKRTMPSEKNLLRLNYVYHLKSEIYGYLKEGVSTFDVLRYLYPPPTIWGIPKDWGGANYP